MKHYNTLWLLSVALLVSSCSSLTNAPQTLDLAELKVADTIYFGSVTLGLLKDTTIVFENTSQDTLNITGQNIANKTYSIPDSNQQRFKLAPHSKKSVTLRFAPKDSANAIASDTVWSGHERKIIILHGSTTQFSSLFPSVPSSISFRLTGLKGTEERTNQFDQGFDFSFFAASPYRRGDTVIYLESFTKNLPNYENIYEYNKIYILFDSVEKRIAWLYAYSSYEDVHNSGIDGHYTEETSQSIVAHNISLESGSSGYFATITDTLTLSNTIASATYLQSYVSPSESIDRRKLGKILGYDSTSILKIQFGK